MADQLALTVDVPTQTRVGRPGPALYPAGDGGLFALPTTTPAPMAVVDPAGLLFPLDPRVVQPDPAWLDQAACSLPTPGEMDHENLTTEAEEYARTHSGRYVLEHRTVVRHRVWRDDLTAAKATCLACPVMLACRTYAIHIADVPGVAGAWTETKRATYRAEYGIPTPGADLEPDGITLAVLIQVEDLTAQGWTAARIAAHLDSPEIDADTVAYARQVIAGSKPRRRAS